MTRTRKLLAAAAIVAGGTALTVAQASAQWVYYPRCGFNAFGFWVCL